jgi:DNA-directed RNA polymerase subunit beta
MSRASDHVRMVDPFATIRQFGRVVEIAEVPDLVEIQTRAYEEFLLPYVQPSSRQNHGLEALLREVFPIYSYDKTMCLEYVGYELGRPRYTIDEAANSA